MSRTLKQLAQESLDVQDACNLSGVLHGAYEAMLSLRKLGVYNAQHPIMQLWADKIAHLTGTQTIGADVVSTAYTEVYKLVEEP
jgi:hypothetical protein